MRINQLAAAVLCAHLGLAVPHQSNHQNLHNHAHKRSVTTVYSTAVDVVTVTDYNAVVWVDNSGNVVTTEHKTLSTAALPSSSSPVSTTTTSSKSMTTPTSESTLSSSSTSKAATDNVQSSEQSKHAPTTSLPTSIASSLTASTLSPSTSAIGKATSNNKVFPGFGVAYDAWTGTSCRPGLDGEFAFLASQGAHSLRVYDVCFAESVNSAAAHGLRLMLGITDFDHFDRDLGSLISQVTSTAAGWSIVDTVFIGNELVNNRRASSADVAGKVAYARGILKDAGFTGAVVTVDTWTAVRDDPSICSTSDFCAVNAHAYFDQNTYPQDAGAFVRRAMDAVFANTHKTVVVTETGWPHAGAVLGVAVPSVQNQRIAMESVVREFTGNDANGVYLFMAYDAHYKTGDEVERNFGIFDLDHYDGTP